MGSLQKPRHSFESSYPLFYLWSSWKCCGRTPPAGRRVKPHQRSLTHLCIYSESLTYNCETGMGSSGQRGASVNVGPPLKPCALVLISLLV